MKHLQNNAPARMNYVLRELKKLFPHAHCELTFSTKLELLISVMLSAQATDVSVNKVTPTLFRMHKSASDYVRTPLEDLQKAIQSIGLYKTKAKNIKAMADILMRNHGGQVPCVREDLEALPGVGRKTANVVLSVGFGIPAFAVDTHITRISYRLGFSTEKSSAREVEEILTTYIAQSDWVKSHHRMIFFGRYHCKARTPLCSSCPFAHTICCVSKQFL